MDKETKDLSGREDWLEEYEGELAIDAYQTGDSVIVKAPIAGVNPEDLDISITNEVVTVKGKREEEREISRQDYFCQECYWGGFARSYVLPLAVNPDRAEAALKNGILTIKIPKLEKSKTRVVRVKAEE